MIDRFAFLGDNKCKATIAATISLGVLLLLPASLGYGGTITIQEAFGQLTPPLDEGEEAGGSEDEAIPASSSTFLLRGFIGSSLPAQGGDIPTENGSGYIVNGRWRIFANESLVNRFVAEMDLAAIDGTAINGTAFHNITIEETTPHRFQLTGSSGNGTTSNTTTATGSVPPVSSNLMTRIYVDGNTPIIDNVPLTISIRGQVLAIEGIDVDETRVADTGQRNILSIIDGQSIFGIVSR
ncbi:MAG: hypothetical protein M3298_04705 [Thermoproteota archaeon]|jgi:hypothetical protein|nr:hypothetical protein [Thermoproteota archaeon]MDQ3807450.1 hypothetical protein [Thermoproteota archaeon]